MNSTLIPLAGTSPVDQISTAVTSEATGAALAAGVLIAAVAAAAFGIKAAWVAWRAGSKAVGKTGT